MTARTVRLWLACLALAATTSCASGGTPAKLAAEQMELGYRAARRGYWQEALGRFQQADSLRPGQARILNNLAVALEAVGRFDDALATYERARGIAPADRNLSRNHKSIKEFHASYLAKKSTSAEPEAGAEAAADGEEKAGHD